MPNICTPFVYLSFQPQLQERNRGKLESLNLDSSLSIYHSHQHPHIILAGQLDACGLGECVPMCDLLGWFTEFGPGWGFRDKGYLPSVCLRSCSVIKLSRLLDWAPWEGSPSVTAMALRHWTLITHMVRSFGCPPLPKVFRGFRLDIQALAIVHHTPYLTDKWTSLKSHT